MMAKRKHSFLGIFVEKMFIIQRKIVILQNRTTAVFLIQYLRSIGYKNVNNDMFSDHSWYFRNALVRANYKNISLGVEYDYSFLERFFRNLLLGENNELKNRYMVICPPKELSLPDKSSDSTQEKGQSTQEIILEQIRNNPRITRNELAEIIGITPDGIKKQLDKLRKADVIKHIGSTKAGEWVILVDK